jgi:hypothetical protein
MLVESIPVNKEVIPLFILNRNKRSPLGSTVYCTECQKTFFVPELLLPNSKLQTCSNCNTTSYISTSDKIERVFLELHEENNKRSASLVYKNDSYKFVGDEVEKQEKNSFIYFDPESFISSNDNLNYLWNYLDMDNPISFIYKATKYKLGATAKLFEQQYYRIYKTISEYLFGEELPVHLFFAYMIYDHFPILKLSSDFLYSLKCTKHREIFKDANITTVKDLLTFMGLPHKKSIIRNLLDTPIQGIDFYRLPIICKQFNNIDIKTSVLKHILDYYKTNNVLTMPENHTLFLLPEHFEVFAGDAKKELSENKLADFIIRDDIKRESPSPDVSYGYTQKSNSFLNYSHNSDMFRMYHTIKKNDEYKNMEILKQERKSFTPQHLHDIFSKMQNYITMKDKNKPYEIKDLCKYEEEIDELKFTVPHQPSDLASWGSMMHNCIASYSDRFRTGESLLLGIYDSKCGELLYNMEIKRNRVVQLRAKRNSSVEDINHRHIINKYCKKHDIEIA